MSGGLQFLLNEALAHRLETQQLDEWACSDLRWWITTAGCPIPMHRDPPSVTMSSDASNVGWGAAVDTAHAGGPWYESEAAHHINWKELIAVWLGLKSLLRNASNQTIRLEIDNTTTVAYLNHQGGTHSRRLCTLAIQVLEWAAARHLELEAVHVPGALNHTADYLSRHVEETGDWMLPYHVFTTIQQTFGPLSVDLFAARHNARLPRYLSWRPDPEAEAVDAFSTPPELWENAYAFPPFSLLTRCLRYIRQHDIRRVIVVAPAWQSQAYYPQLLRMSCSAPLRLVSSDVLDPQGQVHPQAQRLRLTVWSISGKQPRCEAFRRELSLSGSPPGELAPTQRISQHGDSVWAGVANDVWIPYRRTLLN